jgi:hypothetical protein
VPDDQKRTATEARIAGVAIILALGAFYILVGHEWYFSGHMVLCTYDESTNAHSWCYKPPVPAVLPNSTVGTDEFSTNLSVINDSYRGRTQYWNDSFVSELFGQINDLLMKWFQQFVDSWFWPVFAPRWNAFFASEGHRLAFGIVVGSIYAALVSKIIGSLVDWAHGK